MSDHGLPPLMGYRSGGNYSMLYDDAIKCNQKSRGISHNSVLYVNNHLKIRLAAHHFQKISFLTIVICHL